MIMTRVMNMELLTFLLLSTLGLSYAQQIQPLGTCDETTFRSCLVQLFDATSNAVQDSGAYSSLCYSDEFSSLKTCVETYLDDCGDVPRELVLSTVRPYVNLLTNVKDAICMPEFEPATCEIEQATKCLRDFTEVFSRGSIKATCKQAQIAVPCTEYSWYSCSGVARYFVSMVTDQVLLIQDSLCLYDDCDLDVADQCLQEAKAAIETPITIIDNSLLTCGKLRTNLVCANNHTLGCEMDEIPDLMRSQFQYVYEYLNTYCSDGAPQQASDSLPAELRNSFFLASVASNQWSSVNNMCRLFRETMRSSASDGNAVSMYTGNLLTWQHSMDINLAMFAGICLSGPLVDCAWQDGSSTGPVCDVELAENCVDKLDVLIVMANIQRQSWDSVCGVAATMMSCMEHYLEGCVALSGDVSMLNQSYASLLTVLNDHCNLANSTPSCDYQLDTCEPRRAITECTPQQPDVCRNQQEIFDCFSRLTSACTSLEAVFPQRYLNWMLRSCDFNKTLLADDYLLGAASCKLQLGDDLYTGLLTATNFNAELCSAVNTHYVCLSDKTAPPLALFYMGKYEPTLTQIQQLYCGSNAGARGTISTGDSQEGCDVEFLAAAVASMVQQLYSLGLESLGTWQDACSVESFDVIKVVQNSISNCSLARREVFENATNLLTAAYSSICSVATEGLIERTCDAGAIQRCFRKAGTAFSTAGLQSDHCGNFGRTLDCVYNLAEGCDETVQQYISSEIGIIHSMMGNISCPNMSWCDGVTDSDGWLSTACGEYPVCDLNWMECITVTSIDQICPTAFMITLCLVPKLNGCSDLQYAKVAQEISNFESNQGLQCSLLASSSDAVPDVYNQLAQCPLHLYTTQDVTKAALCNDMGQYLQCIQTLMAQSQLPVVLQGILGSNVRMWQKRLYPECQSLGFGETFGVWDTPLEAEGSTCDTQQGWFCLRNLAAGSLDLAVSQLSSRQSICTSTGPTVDCVRETVGGCDAATQTSMLTSAQWLTEGLAAAGTCLDSEVARDCRPREAMDCIADLGLLLAKYGQDSKYVVCSEFLTTAMCVSEATSSCHVYTKMAVETTFSEVSSIVQQVCSPAPSTPTTQCTAPGEATVCDLEEALTCMVPVVAGMYMYQRTSTLQDVCSSIPEMKSCIQKHTASCDDYTLSIVHNKLTKLATNLNDQCPEIYCDVCEARVCLASLHRQLQRPQDSICSLIADTRQCLYTSAYACAPEVGESLLQELEQMTGEEGQICQITLPGCLQAFTTSAMQIMNYNGYMGSSMTNGTASYYGDGILLQATCAEATRAYQCITYHQANLDRQRAMVVNSTMQTVAEILAYRCQDAGLQCYTCSNQTSNEACNDMGVQTCGPDAQMCGTVVDERTISKGCVAPETCTTGCTGNMCSFCCRGDMCNQPATTVITEPDTCQPQTAVLCATELVMEMTQNRTLDCSLAAEAIDCMRDSTVSCMSDLTLRLGQHAQRLLTSEMTSQCLTASPVCQCGMCTSLILVSVVSTPYYDTVAYCRSVAELYNRTMAEMNSTQCTASQEETTLQNLRLAAYLLQDVCMVQPAQIDCYYYGMMHMNGSRFTTWDGCNNCTCRNGNLNCSQQMCPPDKTHCHYYGMVYRDRETFPAIDGCNTCTCSEDGFGCTERACLPAEDDCYYSDERYSSGARFNASDGCNSCRCVAGKTLCTQSICPQGTCDYEGVVYGNGAVIAHSDDCNVCYCNYGNLICSIMYCPPEPTDRCPAEDSSSDVCTEDCREDRDCAANNVCCDGCCRQPYIEGGDHCHYDSQVYSIGDVFLATDGCNVCLCAGGHETCTEFACPNPKTECSYYGSVFMSGDMFMSVDGCNECSCYHGNVQCTERTCIPDGGAKCNQRNVTYQSGEVFVADEGCNICLCANGQSVCTQLTCVEGGGSCYYGNHSYNNGDLFTATDGCNMCVCANGVAGCTRMACPTSDVCWYGNRRYQTGDVFLSNDGCNTCFCSDNGGVGCTKMMCPPDDGSDVCDIRGIRQCMQAAALPSQAAMATSSGTNHICMSARDMLRCVHPRVNGCQNNVLEAVRTALWWNLAHVEQFCNVTHIVTTYHDSNPNKGDNTTHPKPDYGPCDIEMAFQCFARDSVQTCGDLQDVIDCVQGATGHCLSTERVPALYHLWTVLEPFQEACSFQFAPDYEDALYPVAQCTLEFATNISSQMSWDFTHAGAMRSICRHLAGFQHCLFATELAPLGRMYLGTVVDYVSQLSTGCEALWHEEEEEGDALSCRYCVNAGSLEICDRQGIQTCRSNRQMCHVTMQLNATMGTTVTKGCAEPEICQALAGCDPSLQACVYCCYGNQCNRADNATTTPAPYTTTPGLLSTPEPEECQLNDVSNLMVVQMVMLMNYNFVPLAQRDYVCKGFESSLDVTMEMIKMDCSQETAQRVKDVSDWLLELTDYVCPGDAVDEDRCSQAIQCVDHLGNYTNIKDMCRDANKSVTCLNGYLDYCPGEARRTVMQTQMLLTDMIDEICRNETLIPDRPVPHCIDVMATNMSSAKCDPQQVVRCAEAVHQASHNPFNKQEDFCMKSKRAMHCVRDHSFNCTQDEHSRLGPVITEAMWIIGDRCPEIWCPVSDRCKLGYAVQCLSHLEEALVLWGSGHQQVDICGTITATYHCVMNTTEECWPADRQLVSQQFYLLAHNVYSYCHQPPDNVTDCLEVGGASLHTLVGFDPWFMSYALEKQLEIFQYMYQYNQHSTVNNGTNYGGIVLPGVTSMATSGYQGNSSRQGMDGVAVMSPAPGYGNMVTAYGISLPGAGVYGSSFYSRNGTDSRSNGTSSQSNGTSSHSNGTGGGRGGSAGGDSDTTMLGEFINMIRNGSLDIVFDESIIQSYTATKKEVCGQVETALKCVWRGVQQQEEKRRHLLETMLRPIHMMTQDFCQETVCHSCHGLESNDQCNRQPLSVCGPLQVCHSRVEKGGMIKGCMAFQRCEAQCRQEGREHCYCCHGNMCNEPPRFHSGDHCDLSSALECTGRIASLLMQNHTDLGRMDRVRVHEAARCVLNTTRDCRGSPAGQLRMATNKIIKFIEAAECSDSYGFGDCNVPGINTLTSVLQNPHHSQESACRLFTSVLESHAELAKSGACKNEDLNRTRNYLRLVHSRIGGNCNLSSMAIRGLDQGNMTRPNDTRCGNLTGSVPPGSNSTQNGRPDNGRPGNETSVPTNCSTGEIVGPVSNISTVCNVTMTIRQCFAPVWDSSREQKCSSAEVTRLFDCMENFTSGCMGLQAASVLVPLQGYVSKCGSSAITVALARWPQYGDDNSTEVTDCLDRVGEINGILTSSANVQSGLCQVVRSTLQCVGNTSEDLYPQYRMFAHAMMERLSEDVDHLCQNVSTPGNETSPVPCPAGSTNRCSSDPCLSVNVTQRCPNFPLASCYPSYCAYCQPHFYFRGVNVTSNCTGQWTRTCDVDRIASQLQFYLIWLTTRDLHTAADSAHFCGNLADMETLQYVLDECNMVYRESFRKLLSWVQTKAEIFCTSTRSEAVSHVCTTPTCNVTMATDHMTSLAPYLVSGEWLDGFFCSKVEYALQQLECQVGNCSSSQASTVSSSVGYVFSMIRDRCPHIAAELYCKGTWSEWLASTFPGSDMTTGTTVYPPTGHNGTTTTVAPPTTRNGTFAAGNTTIPPGTTRVPPGGNGTTVAGLNVTVTTVRPNNPNRPSNGTGGNQTTPSPGTRPGGRTTIAPTPPSTTANTTCVNDGPEWCLFNVTFPERNRTHYCQNMTTAVQRLGRCVSSRLEGCGVEARTRAITYFSQVQVLKEARAVCGMDFQLNISSQTCELSLPQCSVRRAHQCIDALHPSPGYCGNFPEVAQCVAMATQGCSDLQRYPVLYVLKHWAKISKIPDACVASTFNSTQTGPRLNILLCVDGFLHNVSSSVSRNQSGSLGMCGLLHYLHSCMQTEVMSYESPSVVSHMFQPMVTHLNKTLAAICSQEGREGDEEAAQNVSDHASCNMERAVLCFNAFSVNTLLGNTMTIEGKEILCHSRDTSTQCLKTSLAGCSHAAAREIWMAFRLMGVWNQVSLQCDPHPFVCDAREALNCVADLGRAVSSYGIFASRWDVCRTLTRTKQCISQYMYNCGDSARESIMKTFQPISCRALTICPMAIDEEDETMETRPSCIDPTNHTTDEHVPCNTNAVTECLHNSRWEVLNILTSKDQRCMIHSKAVRCALRHLQNCKASDRVTELMHRYLFAWYGQYGQNCPTRFQPHCARDPSPGCNLYEAEERCINEVVLAAEMNATEHMCLLQSQKDQCIDLYTRDCPNVARGYMRNRLTLGTLAIVAKSINCSTLHQCAYRFQAHVDFIRHHSVQSSMGTEGAGSRTTMLMVGNSCEALQNEYSCMSSTITELPQDVAEVAWSVFGKYRDLAWEGCAAMLDANRGCPACDGHCKACFNSTLAQSDIPGLLLSFLNRPESSSAHNYTSGNGSMPGQSQTQNATQSNSTSQQFCSSYNATLRNFFNYKLNGSQCRPDTQEWSWHSSLDESLLALYRRYCELPCNETLAQTCVDTFQTSIINKTPTEICSLYDAVAPCLSRTLKNCGPDVMATLMSQADDIFQGTGTVCYTMPAVEVITKSRVMTLAEGGSSGFIDVTLAAPPVEGCFGVPCQVEVSLSLEDAMSSCEDGSLVQELLSDTCSVIFTEGDWNRVRSMELSARVDHYIGQSNASVTLTAALVSQVDGSVLLEMPVTSIDVDIVETETASYCFVSDMYISTFDDLYYNNIVHGEILLYGRMGMTYKVHAGFVYCQSSFACTCIVMIQSRDDVFVVDGCRRRDGSRPAQELTVYKNGVLEPSTRVFADRAGQTFEVLFPYGTLVTVQLMGETVDVWIKPSPSDFNQTRGLCGTYNGNQEDEFIAFDGMWTTLANTPVWNGFKGDESILVPVDFTVSWRTQVTLFNGVDPVDSIELDSTLCDCQSATCSPTSLVEICNLDLGREITSDLDFYTVSGKDVQQANRRKRQTTGLWGDIEWTEETPDVSQLPSWPTASGITEDEALDHCEAAIVNTEVGQSCVSAVNLTDYVNMCMSDILLTDSRNKTVDTVDRMKVQCRKAIIANPTIALSMNMSQSELVSYITSHSCLMDCSGHGSCENEACQCNSDYGGADCAIRLDDSPGVTSLATNLYASLAASVTVTGENFANTPSLTCHYERLEIDENGYNQTGLIETRTATFVSQTRVQCQLTGSLPVSAFLLSVSNNGANQSAQLLFIVHDSDCYDCDPAAGTCELKYTVCLVDGVCYQPGVANPNDPCYLCSSISNTWEYKQIPGLCPALTTTTISTSTTTQSTTSSTQSTSSATESTSSATESTSSATESTSSATESTSSATESTSSATESTSSATEATSTATESTSTATESRSTQSTVSSTQSTASTTGPGVQGTTDDQSAGDTGDSDPQNLMPIIIGVGAAVGVIILVGVVCIAVRQRRSSSRSPREARPQPPDHLEPTAGVPHLNPEGRPNPTFHDVTYDNARGIRPSQASARCAPFNPEGLEGQPGVEDAAGPNASGQGDNLYRMNMDFFQEPNASEEPQRSGGAVPQVVVTVDNNRPSDEDVKMEAAEPDYAVVHRARGDDTQAYDNAGYMYDPSLPRPADPVAGDGGYDSPSPDYDDQESTPSTNL